MMPRVAFAFLIVVALATCAAAGTPEERCQKGRYAAAAKYGACEQNATAALHAGKFTGDYPKYLATLGKCLLKYTRTWDKLEANVAGTGVTCDAARFVVSGATVVDRLTGLRWEQKTNDASVHDTSNLYTWNATGMGSTAADGTVFTTFLATLNGGGCFEGQCDWRLPTLLELQTILTAPHPCTLPCIDEGLFGPTAPNRHWTATTYATVPIEASTVYFNDGLVDRAAKNALSYARAVRGGL